MVLPATVARAGDCDGNGGVIVLPGEDGVCAGVGTPGDETSSGSGSGSSHSCWFKLDADSDGNPKWPFVDTTTGKITNAWFFLYCDGQLVDPIPRLLAVDGSAIRPAARVMAEQASRFMPLPAPQVGRNPSGRALVRVPLWLWAEAESWGTRTIRVGVTGLSVVVTAQPESLTWTFGTTARLVCDGPGRRYDPTRPAKEQATDCSHTFARTSAREPGGTFAAGATTTWRITWLASDGTSGSLPALQRTTAFRLPVGQVQTLVTRSS